MFFVHIFLKIEDFKMEGGVGGGGGGDILVGLSLIRVTLCWGWPQQSYVYVIRTNKMHISYINVSI